MNEITLLSEEQVFGKQKIDVIEKMGTKCAITDFAILLDAYVSDDYRVDDDISLKGRTGWWYLSSSVGYGGALAVGRDGKLVYSDVAKRSGGIRPVLPYADIPGVLKNAKRNNRGVLEVEYGEYPQYVVDTSLGRKLDSEFAAGILRKTGKTYTTDSRREVEYEKKFSPIEHEEFEYNGKRYVRVNSNNCICGHLTSGTVFYPYEYSDEYYWIEVSPITWLVDEESKLLISKNLLASGVRFCNNGPYYGDFENTEMYEFLNDYFAREILLVTKDKMTVPEGVSSDTDDLIEKFNVSVAQTLVALQNLKRRLEECTFDSAVLSPDDVIAVNVLFDEITKKIDDNEASIQKLLSLRQKLQELETRKPKDYDVNEEDGFIKFLRFSKKNGLCSEPIDYQFW